MRHPGEIFADTLHQLEADLLVRHLATAELELDTHLEPMGEEILGMGELDRVVVRADIHSELDLFFPLFGLLGLLQLGLLILEFAVVNDTAYRRACIGGDLDEVESQLFGFGKRLVCREHDVVLSIDHTNFGGSNSIVHPRPNNTRPAFHGFFSDGVVPPLDECVNRTPECSQHGNVSGLLRPNHGRNGKNRLTY